MKLLSLLGLAGMLSYASTIFAVQTYSCPDISQLEAVEVDKAHNCWQLQNQNGQQVYPIGSYCTTPSPGDKKLKWAYAGKGGAGLLCFYGAKEGFLIPVHKGSNLYNRIKSGECRFNVPDAEFNTRCGGASIEACTIVCK